MNKKETHELLSVLNKSHTDKDLEVYLDTLHDISELSDVTLYLETLLTEKNLLKSNVILHSQLDRTYAYQIFNGTRKGTRDKMLALCISMKLTLLETNRVLTLNGNNILYAKNKRDAIIIYCLNQHASLYDVNMLLEQKKETILAT